MNGQDVRQEVKRRERRKNITNEKTQQNVAPHLCIARGGRAHETQRNKFLPKSTINPNKQQVYKS